MVRRTGNLDMTIAVNWGRKTSNQTYTIEIKVFVHLHVPRYSADETSIKHTNGSQKHIKFSEDLVILL